MRCRRVWCVVLLAGLGCGETKTPPSAAANPAKTVPPKNGELLSAPSSNGRSNAVADKAFADLLEATHGSNPDAWSAAEKSLTELGAQAVPALARYLAHDDQTARELAVQFLAQLGPDAKGAEPALTKALADDSPMVRVNAAAALLALNASATEAVAALRSMLQDDDASVRLPAAISLAGMSDAVKDAVPVLTELLTAREPSIRQTAAETLGKLGKNAESSLGALQQLESDDNTEVRSAAAAAVNAIEAAENSSSETKPADSVENETNP